MPKTAEPPYSQDETSTRGELDRLGLTAMKSMVGVEPYGTSDLGADPSDVKPPSLSSASASEDNDPEDAENPSDKKKKNKRKSRHHERRCSKAAKAIDTSKIVRDLPEGTEKDLSKVTESVGRVLRMTGQTNASERVECDLVLQCCKSQYLEK